MATIVVSTPFGVSQQISEAQLKALGTKSLRNFKRHLQRVDTLLEKMEREAARLIERKTRVAPYSLTKIAQLTSQFMDLTTGTPQALSDLESALASL